MSVHEYGKRTRAHDVTDAGGLLSEAGGINNGKPMPRTRESKASDLVGVEAGALDHSCGKGIMRARSWIGAALKSSFHVDFGFSLFLNTHFVSEQITGQKGWRSGRNASGGYAATAF